MHTFIFVSGILAWVAILGIAGLAIWQYKRNGWNG
jgi:hypothetical protein